MEEGLVQSITLNKDMDDISASEEEYCSNKGV